MDTIPVLERAISVIEALGLQGGLTAKRLSAELGIPSATCYRILRTFGRANWIQEGGRGEYRIAFGLARIAGAHSDTERLLGLLRPLLEHLANTTGLSAKISLQEGTQAVTALRAESRRMNQISSPVGTKVHLLEAGSAGMILLAAMPQDESGKILSALPPDYWKRHRREAVEREIRDARKSRLASAFGTVNPSICAISVPLRLTPVLTAALTIVGWPDEFANERRAAHQKNLKKCAAEMSRRIAEETGKEDK